MLSKALDASRKQVYVQGMLNSTSVWSVHITLELHMYITIHYNVQPLFEKQMSIQTQSDIIIRLKTIYAICELLN